MTPKTAGNRDFVLLLMSKNPLRSAAVLRDE
jgi:hypothetical protein